MSTVSAGFGSDNVGCVEWEVWPFFATYKNKAPEQQWEDEKTDSLPKT